MIIHYIFQVHFDISLYFSSEFDTKIKKMLTRMYNYSYTLTQNKDRNYET